jgi:hypothetical protein
VRAMGASDVGELLPDNIDDKTKCCIPSERVGEGVVGPLEELDLNNVGCRKLGFFVNGWSPLGEHMRIDHTVNE